MNEPTGAEVAVVFTSRRTDDDHDGYDRAAARMEELAALQPGYCGIESVRNADGVGITVSYWASTEAAHAWKQHPEHLAVQEAGRERWYEWYRVQVVTLLREYTYHRDHVSHHEDTTG